MMHEISLVIEKRQGMSLSWEVAKRLLRGSHRHVVPQNIASRKSTDGDEHWLQRFNFALTQLGPHLVLKTN